MDTKTIYRLNDEISFRKCSLFEKNDTAFGDCTSFIKKVSFNEMFSCSQDRIHFHCSKHPEIELE